MKSEELQERLRHSGGHIESMEVADGGWKVEVRFNTSSAKCPTCLSSHVRSYGWRRATFHDCPTADGRSVVLVTWRPRWNCGCGRKFVADVPCLARYARITLGLQQYLAREVSHYSVRDLATKAGVAANTVMRSLKAAADAKASADQGTWGEIAIRQLVVRGKTYWLAIDPNTLNTMILCETRCADWPESLIARVVELSPSRIDLPIPLDVDAAARLQAKLPKALLSISSAELNRLVEDTLRNCANRLGYKLRSEGLTLKRAHELCFIRAKSMQGGERKHFDALHVKTPFWEAYRTKEHFLCLLEKGSFSYRQAIQKTLEQASEVVRPMFGSVFRQLIRLDEIGAELQCQPQYDQVQLKIDRLRARMTQQGARFEFPLLSAIILLFTLGYAGQGWFSLLRQSLEEMRDIVFAPDSFVLSDVECRAILLA